jgi:hypothetical protein
MILRAQCSRGSWHAKYPHLADEEASGSFPDTSPDGPDVADDADEEISLLDEIAEAGGPDLP